MKYDINKINQIIEQNSDILNSNEKLNILFNRNDRMFFKLKRNLKLLINVVDAYKQYGDETILKVDSNKVIQKIHNLNLKLKREEISLEKNPFTYYDAKVDKNKTNKELLSRYKSNIKYKVCDNNQNKDDMEI